MDCKYSFLTIALIVSLAAASCASTKNRIELPLKVNWGSTAKHVIANENRRHKGSPLLSLHSKDNLYRLVRYKEKFIESPCTLSYYFKKDNLFMTYLGCTSPKLTDIELAQKVQSYFIERYEKSNIDILGSLTFHYWSVGNTNIYVNVSVISNNKVARGGATASIIYLPKALQNGERIVESLGLKYFYQETL